MLDKSMKEILQIPNGKSQQNQIKGKEKELCTPQTIGVSSTAQHSKYKNKEISTLMLKTYIILKRSK